MTVTAVMLGAGGSVTAQAAPIGVPVLPLPGGQYAVGMTPLHLVDDGRADPFVPERDRELMVSAFYPTDRTEDSQRAHYVSSEWLPELEARWGVDLPGVLTNTSRDVAVRGGEEYPVVLYSPGAGVSRVLGTGLAEDIASRGYVVVTIDHTYETSPGVEFPGGRVVQPAPRNLDDEKALRQKYADARLLDVELVLDSLEELESGGNPDAEGRELPPGLGQSLDLDRIGTVGHSLGGYTAVEAMHLDRRIDVAVDLDGQIGVDENFGRAATEGIDRPLLVLTSNQIETVGDARPSLDALWPRATGWKRHLMIEGSAHYDFTDMPALVPGFARPLASTYIGPIPAGRVNTLVRTYVGAFFEKFMRGVPGTVLDGPPTEPEIRTVHE